VLIDSPGGGGFGDPAERDRARVASDTYEGFVSAEAARELYGYEG
jgi:N-methylhydantoinase B/oxoprolinase/acetone carboxylase alpha subunit